MKARLINFPATTLDAAEALGVDVERFCIESLRAIVESMEEKVKKKPKKQPEPAATPRRGRPSAAEPGTKLEWRSVGLEPDLWVWVAYGAKAAKLSQNAFVRQVILRAKSAEPTE